MRHFQSLLILTALLLSSCSANKGVDLVTNNLKLTIGINGNITGLTDLSTGLNYLAKEQPAPLISLMFDSIIIVPQKASSDTDKIISLAFENGISASIGYTVQQSHIRFELLSLSDSADLVIWGPYPTTISKTIGETIGVVRDDKFALGIQALNIRTLGGYPWNDNDCMPQIDIFDQDDPSDMSEQGKRYVLYRVEAAKPTAYGSSLQAYTRNRNKDRVIENMGHEKYIATAYIDEGVIGSSIAIFGCPTDNILETISSIELSENLPHPIIDGEWGKTARSASAAYLILDFGERDIERAIGITKKAGLKYLYQSGPFETWGHFKLREDLFPNGIDGMKTCVEKAAKNDIHLGVHTLSNFITTNDPYVTPIPDKRLAKVGSSTLSGEINASQTSIQIESPDYFNQYSNNNLKTLLIGDELIRYGGVSEEAPWLLTDCQRGAFGTTARSHNKGDLISKLADHAYKVLLTDPDLTIEMAEKLAEFFNKTGVRQISFDGLEGNRSTGMGNYGEVLFTTSWYNALSDEIKQHFIADASRTSHFFWHIYSRMNWGEPWYAGFRESQTEYRLKNQEYFQRNLMPGMLGWFRMTASTSLEDIEWMLARSAAFNAGYAFVTDYNSIEKNAFSDTIFKQLGIWEKLRMADSFSAEQKERMKDINNEFHLEASAKNEYMLYQIFSFKYNFIRSEKQPGEPSYSLYNIENPSEEQGVNFIITASGGTLSDITIGIDNSREIKLEVKLKKGESIKYTRGNTALIYSAEWTEIGTIEIDKKAFNLTKGAHNISFDCSIEGDKDSMAKLEFRLSSTPEIVSIKS